jgi:hypothetical protein
MLWLQIECTAKIAAASKHGFYLVFWLRAFHHGQPQRATLRQTQYTSLISLP